MTILVPTDFSSGAEVALHYAALLAVAQHDDLLIVHVKPSVVLPRGDEDVADDEDPRIYSQLEVILQNLHTVTCRHRLLRGNPPDEILKIADSENVALIVLGAHGLTDSPTVSMGAIATAIMDRAQCTVLTVKHAAKVDAACG